jgi:hypothetical protein
MARDLHENVNKHYIIKTLDSDLIVAERWKFNCVMIVANKYNLTVQSCLGGG